MNPLPLNEDHDIAGQVKADHNTNTFVSDDSYGRFSDKLGHHKALAEHDPNSEDSSFIDGDKIEEEQFHPYSLLVFNNDGELHNVLTNETTGEANQPHYEGDDKINYDNHYADWLDFIYDQSQSGDLSYTKGTISLDNGGPTWIDFGNDIAKPTSRSYKN